jgi:Kef-type K+ transport system membrane component KefB
MRRERQRRPPRLADAAFTSAIIAVLLALAYRFFVGLSWPTSLAIGVVAGVVSTGLNYWLSQRRWRRQHPPQTTRRKR